MRYPDTVGLSLLTLSHLGHPFHLSTCSLSQLLVAHKPSLYTDPPIPPSRAVSTSLPLSRTQFYLNAAAYSYEQRAVVTESMSVLTWYDYDALRKCDPGDEVWAAVRARMK